MNYVNFYSFFCVICSTHYIWPKAGLMIVFNYIVLWTLVWSFKEFKLIENFKRPVTDKHLHFFLRMNFVRSLQELLASSVPIPATNFMFYQDIGNSIWTSKLWGISEMDRNINYHIIFEYFYIGYQYWSYSNKEKFFVKSFITLVITSFISIYHPYNYDVSG